MRVFRPLLLTLLPVLALLGGCGSADDATVAVAVIGDSERLTGEGTRLSPAGQLVRSATREGLVALGPDGEVLPAIAERWIVTDDGLSYIFRLRNSDWPDGTTISATDVRDRLKQNLARLRGTSLGLDLAPVAEIRAMTGRVVEIRLTGPMPGLLQVLAQPEMGLERARRGAGPMLIEPAEQGIVLQPVPPSSRGLPEPEDWREAYRAVLVRAEPAEQAVAAFDDGAVNLVLGGTVVDMPLADTGALSRGTIRLDAALGLLGLEVVRAEGFLATAANREAVALAIDRDRLVQPFNIGGWVATTRIVAPGLPDDDGSVGERWADLSIEERQARARGRVAAWESSTGEELVLDVFLPAGPGSDRLFTQIARGLAEAGIGLRRADNPASADLALKDRLARYAGARWFLNQFNCSIYDGPCSAGADALVRQSLTAKTTPEQVSLLAEAERLMLTENIYIPLGAPIRWSLVRGGLDGFEENRWSVHPLFALAERPM
ncbi:MAG: peptide ABC transporter substrate-binding protein [Sphingomonadaceae bacterium]|nr:peptide ABC transporter substrate-binding protein [Sphingomonadaceae bacterium]